MLNVLYIITIFVCNFFYFLISDLSVDASVCLCYFVFFSSSNINLTVSVKNCEALNNMK